MFLQIFYQVELVDENGLSLGVNCRSFVPIKTALELLLYFIRKVRDRLAKHFGDMAHELFIFEQLFHIFQSFIRSIHSIEFVNAFRSVIQFFGL